MEDAIRYAKKYYFWPVSLIMLVLAMYFWSATTSALDKKFESNESSYKQSKSSVDGIAMNPPSEAYIKAVQAKTRGAKGKIVKAWKWLYDQQILHGQGPEISGIDFKASQISSASCEQYKYRIVEEFKKLTDSLNLVAERDKMGVNIDAEISQKATNAENAAENNAQAPAQLNKELVVWPQADIDALKNTHFTWPTSPSTQDIRVAQEDFWLLQNLFGVLKALNDGVETRNVANLRQINTICITHRAASKFAERREKGFFDEKIFGSAGEEGEAETAEPATGGDSGAEGASTEEGASEGDNKKERQLYNGRYVNSEGVPLSADEYLAVKDTAETRLVPVYMSLIIKQDCVSKLLALLTNAETPVDLKLVLINPGQGWMPVDFSAESNATGASSNADTKAVGGDQAVKGGDQGKTKDSLEFDEIQIDIYGIIRLYNPVSNTRFPQVAEAEEGSDEGQPADEESQASEDNADEGNDEAEDNADTEDKAEVKDTEMATDDVKSDSAKEEKTDTEENADTKEDVKSEPEEKASAEATEATPADAT